MNKVEDQFQHQPEASIETRIHMYPDTCKKLCIYTHAHYTQKNGKGENTKNIKTPSSVLNIRSFWLLSSRQFSIATVGSMAVSYRRMEVYRVISVSHTQIPCHFVGGTWTSKEFGVWDGPNTNSETLPALRNGKFGLHIDGLQLSPEAGGLLWVQD